MQTAQAHQTGTMHAAFSMCHQHGASSENSVNQTKRDLLWSSLSRSCQAVPHAIA